MPIFVKLTPGDRDELSRVIEEAQRSWDMFRDKNVEAFRSIDMFYRDFDVSTKWAMTSAQSVDALLAQAESKAARFAFSVPEIQVYIPEVQPFLAEVVDQFIVDEPEVSAPGKDEQNLYTQASDLWWSLDTSQQISLLGAVGALVILVAMVSLVHDDPRRASHLIGPAITCYVGLAKFMIDFAKSFEDGAK